MDQSTKAGLQVIAEMLDARTQERLKASIDSEAFGSKLGQFSLEFVFAKLWTRPGLARRERSLVTLGILIALRATEELKIHSLIALRNGCTVQEIEEALYQASAYAGFPAAASAYITVMTTLREAGHIK